MSARRAPTRKLPPAGRIAEILDRTAELYARDLRERPAGRRLLDRLGLYDAAMIERHRVGWCDGTMLETLPRTGGVRGELAALGILVPQKRGRHVERFLHCLTFPVRDIDGLTVNLYAENGTPGAPAAALPALRPAVWNAPAAKRCSEILVTRSVLDALALERAGLRNAVAAPAGIAGSEIESIESLGTVCIPVGGEGRPGAGSRPAIRLRDGLGPLEFLLRYGPAALSRAVSDAPERTGTRPGAPGGDLTFRFGPRRYDVFGPAGKGNCLRLTLRAERSGRLHVDTLDLYRASLRRRLCRDLCRLFEEPPEVIEADVTRIVKACEEYEPPSRSGPVQIRGMSAEERAAAEAFGRSPDLLERIRADYERCGLVGEDDAKLVCYLAAVSRKTDEPLSVLILSSSGAGKSTLQNVTLGFCPPEDVVRLTRLTDKALFYGDPTGLRHRVLALAEIDGGEDATRAIRSLISERELVLSATARSPGGGGLKAVRRRVEGPTAVFCTSADPSIDAETRSRFLVVGVDESERQTARVLALQRRRRTTPRAPADGAADRIRRLHRNFQRLLRPLQVVIPFAAELVCGTGRLQARREQPRFLALIAAAAFLHQLARPVHTVRIDGEDVDYIEAERGDAETAARLAAAVSVPGADDLSGPGRELLGILGDMVAERLARAGLPGDGLSAVRFTRREVREYCRWSHYRVHAYLGELLKLEYALLDSRGEAGVHRYRLAPGTGVALPEGRAAGQSAEFGSGRIPANRYTGIGSEDGFGNSGIGGGEGT